MLWIFCIIIVKIIVPFDIPSNTIVKIEFVGKKLCKFQWNYLFNPKINIEFMLGIISPNVPTAQKEFPHALNTTLGYINLEYIYKTFFI